MLRRFSALSKRARKLFGRAAYEPAGQDGVNCLLLALLDQVDELGLPLPAGFDAEALRSACQKWMLNNKTLVVEDAWNEGYQPPGELPLLCDFDDADQYWVGRALRVVKVYTEPGSVAGTAGRARYDAGDCEIAVQWFQRDVSGGSERRTFKVWAADEEAGDAGPVDGETYTFNSTELRLINTPSASAGAIQLEMRPLPPVGGAPLNIVQRASARWHS